MPTDLEPVTGNWYQHLDKGQPFRVVSVDEDAGVIAIQHFDGDLEEVELDGWHQLDLEICEEPEDWTGPLDDVETDDLGYTETSMAADDWVAPLDEAGRRGDTQRPEVTEEPVDDWGEGVPEEEPWRGEQ